MVDRIIVHNWEREKKLRKTNQQNEKREGKKRKLRKMICLRGIFVFNKENRLAVTVLASKMVQNIPSIPATHYLRLFFQFRVCVCVFFLSSAILINVPKIRMTWYPAARQYACVCALLFFN